METEAEIHAERVVVMRFLECAARHVTNNRPGFPQNLAVVPSFPDLSWGEQTKSLRLEP